MKTDRSLVLAAHDHDARARDAWALAFSLVGRAVPWLPHDERRDLAQEVLARVIALGRLDPVHEARAFVWGVTTNVVREHLNRENSRREHIDFLHERPEDEVVVTDAAPSPLAPAVTEPRLAAALLRLPVRDATLLRLRYADDASYDEIAEELGTYGRAASRAHDTLIAELRGALGLVKRKK